jgi:hypothetical protein
VHFSHNTTKLIKNEVNEIRACVNIMLNIIYYTNFSALATTRHDLLKII